MQEKDTVFNRKMEKSFEFDESVASVFDDMLSRSVPFYEDVLELTVDLILKHVDEGGRVTDLGCSTASTLLKLYTKSEQKLSLQGVDNSEAMLQRAQRKIGAYNAEIELLSGDLITMKLRQSDIFISNYTLQFIRPLQREKFIQKIADALSEEGVFIFSEKIVYEDKKLNATMIDIYHEYKKEQGYSDLEIMQKREALENVLIPYTEQENIEMLKTNGFKSCTTIFKWANFVTFIAKK
jgi:tRNA (cmo5U34)-methyltransferase